MIDKNEFIRWYKAAKDFADDWRIKASECYDMKAGRQWTQEELDFLRERQRPALTFNRISPVVEAIRGHQVANRQEAKYIPREFSDQGTADLLNACGKWADDLCNAQHHTSDAFGDMAVCGMGWTEMRMDFVQDVRGRLISAERISPMEMLWDPNSSQQNLMDSRYRMRCRWMDKNEVTARWPEFKLLDLEAVEMGTEMDLTDYNIIVETETAYEPGTNQWVRNKNREILVAQCQYFELEQVTIALHPETKEIFEVDKEEDLKMLQEINVKTAKVTKKRFYQLFAVGEQLLEHTPGPHPEQFTLQCMTGIRDENRNYWHGIVHVMIDPQKWSNKFLSDIQDYVASNRGGGAFVEADAFVDARKAEESWNDPSGMIMLTSGAIGAGKIKERAPLAYPQGLDRLMQFAIQAIPDVTGVNMEMMGMADRAQAGVLEAQRKQAGLTILAPLFNALNQYLQVRGRTAIHFFKTYLSDGRMVRILGPEPGMEKYVPLVLTEDVESFDVVVDTAPTAPDMKAQVFLVLRDLIPYMAKMGIPPPLDIFEYLPLPAGLVDRWKTTVQQAKQQQGQGGKDPKAQALAQKAQMDAQKSQMDMQVQQQRAQIEQQKLQLEAQRMQMQFQLDSKRLEFEQQKLQADSQKLQAEMMAAQSKGQGESAKAQAASQKAMMDIQKAQFASEQARAMVQKAQADAQKANISMRGKELDLMAKAPQGTLFETNA